MQAGYTCLHRGSCKVGGVAMSFVARTWRLLISVGMAVGGSVGARVCMMGAGAGASGTGLAMGNDGVEYGGGGSSSSSMRWGRFVSDGVRGMSRSRLLDEWACVEQRFWRWAFMWPL